ncbi:MAG: class I SAM-dependent methyltransferase [Natronospirillum sp.]|uniref:DUF938 domain-containing protein n=1 Tax=Natronospirillum sp. TaxID=2812955 RepID=UPI0025DC4DFD|nr:DUF938 domain-containing protein [Natronospirillum sp.]MCH8551014.1 class I SAM-dependent methyltransferase [Natronospirillum sp.]
MSSEKPFSQACENNKRPILKVLQQVLPQPGNHDSLILEIGAGTGQHAAWFASNMRWLQWQPTDQAHYLPGCRLWVEEALSAGVENLLEPKVLDVLSTNWSAWQAEAAFSANTAHIMHWPAVEAMFRGLAKCLVPGGAFCLYGPFRYHGEHTSDSNHRFDQHLRQQDPGMGIRDMDELLPLAERSGFELEAYHAMPANNRTLVWRLNS